MLAGWCIRSSARVCRYSSINGSTSISSAVGSGCRDLAANEGGCRTDSGCALRCGAGEDCKQHCCGHTTHTSPAACPDLPPR